MKVYVNNVYGLEISDVQTEISPELVWYSTYKIDKWDDDSIFVSQEPFIHPVHKKTELWKNVYKRVNKFMVFDSIDELESFLFSHSELKLTVESFVIGERVIEDRNDYHYFEAVYSDDKRLEFSYDYAV